jgi:hypothetical protein
VQSGSTRPDLVSVTNTRLSKEAARLVALVASVPVQERVAPRTGQLAGTICASSAGRTTLKKLLVRSRLATARTHFWPQPAGRLDLQLGYTSSLLDAATLHQPLRLDGADVFAHSRDGSVEHLPTEETPHVYGRKIWHAAQSSPSPPDGRECAPTRSRACCPHAARGADARPLPGTRASARHVGCAGLRPLQRGHRA